MTAFSYGPGVTTNSSKKHGNDGKTYGNPCVLEQARCEENKDLSVILNSIKEDSVPSDKLVNENLSLAPVDC